MSVSVSGPVLADLLYEQASCHGDQEGFLLGSVINHVTDTISDNHLNNRKEETVTYIYNYIPCCDPFSWYDHAGRVLTDKLKAVIKGHKPQEVVGWYKWRRQSTMTPSLRERAIHGALVRAFPRLPSQRFLFSLFSCSATSNLSTHSFDYIFQCQTGGTFVRLPVTVVNLKDTSQADYKLQPNHNIDPAEPGIYADTLKRARPEFLDTSTGRLHQVEGIHLLNCQLHQKLKDLYDKVSCSEEAVGSLATEVEILREQWKRKRHQPRIMQTDLSRRPQSQTQASVRHTAKSDLNGVSKYASVPVISVSSAASKGTRHRSKQEEISDELKDLFVTPIIGKPDVLTEPSPTLAPLTDPAMDMVSPSAVLLTSPSSSSGDANDSTWQSTSGGLSTPSAKSFHEGQDLAVEPLPPPKSPAATRKSRSKINNVSSCESPAKTKCPGEGASAVTHTAEVVVPVVEKPSKKDAFDFVNNLMQDLTPKANSGLKRNTGAATGNPGPRKTRAQSMFVGDSTPSFKATVANQWSVTPTGDPGNRTRSGRDFDVRQKASTLPNNMGSSKLDESMDEEVSSSPTF